jgi:hypothetical protein
MRDAAVQSAEREQVTGHEQRFCVPMRTVRLVFKVGVCLSLQCAVMQNPDTEYGSKVNIASATPG